MLLRGEAVKHAPQLLNGLVPGLSSKTIVDIATFEGKADEIIPWLQPAIFGIRRELQTVSGERENLATLRLVVHGTRVVVVVRAAALVRFVEQEASGPAVCAQFVPPPWVGARGGGPTGAQDLRIRTPGRPPYAQGQFRCPRILGPLALGPCDLGHTFGLRACWANRASACWVFLVRA